jgi:hypothetical protein
LKQDVSKNPTECDHIDPLPTDEQLVQICTPFIAYIEGTAEATTFLQQLNEPDDVTDDQSKPLLPEFPEQIPGGQSSLFSEGGYDNFAQMTGN